MMPKVRSLVIPKDHTSIKCAVCSVKGGYMVSELWTHIGIMRFRMLEGVKAVLRLYDLRTLISVRDLSKTLFIGTQRSE